MKKRILVLGLELLAALLLGALLVGAQVISGPSLQYQWTVINTTTTGQVGKYLSFNAQQSGIPSTYSLAWSVTGTTPTACTFGFQGSNDLQNWFALDAGGVSCTASSVEFITNRPVIAIRVNLATWTPGSATSVVTFNYVGSNVPGGGGGGGTVAPGGVLDVRSYGAALNGVTDDTAAFQNGVTACFTQNGSLFIPSTGGRMHLAGAINPACNALVCAPSVAVASPSQQCEIFGNVESEWVGAGGMNPSGTIETAVSAGTDANSAIIGVPSVAGNFGSFDNIILKVRNLSFLTYPNPSIGAVNCVTAGECFVDHITYSNGESYTGTRTQPTNNRTAVILPGVNNWNKAYFHNSTTFGIYAAVKVSEHADLENDNFQSGIQGIVTTAGYHSAHFKNVTIGEVVTPIVATGGGLAVQFDNLDLEIDPTHVWCTWCYSAVDVSDAGNFLNGNLTYTSRTAGPGTANPLHVTGGVNLFYSVLSGGGAMGGFVSTFPPLSQTVIQPTNSQFKISGNASSFTTPYFLTDSTTACNTFCSGGAETGSGVTAGGVLLHSIGVTLGSNYNSASFGFKYVGNNSTSNYGTLGLYNINDVITWSGAGNVTLAPAAGTVTISGGGQTVLRCTTAGALPIGALTVAAGNCGASTDTGLRFK